MAFNQTVQHKLLKDTFTGYAGLEDSYRAALVHYVTELGIGPLVETVNELQQNPYHGFHTDHDVNVLRAAIDVLMLKPIIGAKASYRPVSLSQPEGSTNFDRFIRRRVLQFLIDKAYVLQTTTYEELAQNFGLPDSGNSLGSALTPVLTSIFIWCNRHGLPHMTSLVVRKSGADQGIPGSGLWHLLGESNLTRDERRARTAALHNEVFDFFADLT